MVCTFSEKEPEIIITLFGTVCVSAVLCDNGAGFLCAHNSPIAGSHKLALSDKWEV
jgi:hypothetical protein